MHPATGASVATIGTCQRSYGPVGDSSDCSKSQGQCGEDLFDCFCNWVWCETCGPILQTMGLQGMGMEGSFAQTLALVPVGVFTPRLSPECHLGTGAG